ncbi:MAG: GMC oxidoreductase [Acidobacteriota bacterium]
MARGLSRRAFLTVTGAAPLGRALCIGQSEPPRHADVVVVGGDAAAYAAVFRLAQRPGLRVTLVADRAPWQPAPNPPSTLADLPPFVRGHQGCFDGWRDRGNSGWGYADVLPVFKRLERYEAGASDTRGGDGPLSVRHCWDPNAGHRAFLMAAGPAGYRQDSRHDFNGPRSQGVAGYYQKAMLDDRPHSFDAAFLAPVRHTSPVTTASGGYVSRVVMEGTRAVGVEYVSAGRCVVIRATQAVVLCLTPVRAAQVLMLSGIGPGERLRALGVPIVADRAGVGRNLHDQITVPLRYASPQALAASTVSAGMFTVSLSASPPDLQFDVVVPRAGRRPEIGVDVTLVRPSSRGEVVLSNADASAAPVVSLNALHTESDLRALVQGLRLGRLIMTGAPLDALRGDETAATAPDQTTAALEQRVRALGAPCGHLAGTCAMGPASDPEAVVDATLAVHGTRGLRVAGAAVMPDIVNAPPDAAALMVGDRCAEFVLSGWFAGP